MADRYWIASTAQNWNNTSYWSTTSGGSGGASVPGSSDHAHFDLNGVGECQLNVGFTIASLTVTSGNSSKIDGTHDTSDCTVSGDTTLDGSGSLWFGARKWSYGGSFDCADMDIVDDDDPTLFFTGSGKTINADREGTNGNLCSVEFSAGSSYTLTATARVQFVGRWLKIYGNVTIPSGEEARYGWAAGSENDMRISSVGSLTGDGLFMLQGSCDMTEMDGNLDLATFIMQNNKEIAPGTYECTTELRFEGSGTREIDFDAGEFIFDCDVHFRLRDDDFTYDLATNNPNFTFKKDVLVTRTTGTMTWNKGTGTVIFAGTSGTQEIQFYNQQIEDVVINASGAIIKLMDDFKTDSITMTAGTVNINGKDVVCSGNWTVSAGCDFTGSGFNSCNIDIIGNMDWSGSSGDLLDLVATALWTLDVTGTAAADYVNVAYSNASGGSEIQATNSTDGTNNSNWNFIIAVDDLLGADYQNISLAGIQIYEGV